MAGDKTAIVTGAGSGIGKAVATTLLKAGWNTVFCGRRVAMLEAAITEAGDVEAGALAVGCDITRPQEVEALFGKAVETFGRVDLLFNNAGISGTFEPDLTSTQAWERLMDVNAKGVFLGMKHGVPLMRLRGGGAIVNMSSISASVGQPRVHMGYSASKAAVQAMTRAAAVHYAEDGIRVNAVAPGMLPAMRTSRGSADPVWREKQIDAVPLKRVGRVEEVAAAVLFLASAEASYITGVEVAVDGGFLSL